MNFTSQIETAFSKIKNHFTGTQITALISVLVAGLVAHGYVLFNRISYHDNAACLFSLGGTYESGRWVLGFIYDIQMMTTKLFSVPVFNGILSLIFIGFAAMLIVDMFQIKSKVAAAFIGAIMSVYPVVTSIFSFMFTAWEYFLALLLAVLSAKILLKSLSVKNFILSAVVLSLSLGIYQAFFAVTIAAFLVSLTLGVLKNEITSIGEYAKRGFTYLAELVVGLGIWGVMRFITQHIKGIEAVDYKGMDDGYSLALLPNQIIKSLSAFFGFRQAGINALLYLRAFTALVVVVTIIQLVVMLVRSSNKVAVKIVSLVGLVFLPIGMNVVYLLSTSEEYHVDSLMVYGNIFVFLLPVFLIEMLDAQEFKAGIIRSLTSIATWIQILSLAVLTVGYIYLDNAAYMKAEIAEEQATAYYTELVANIKATEGFSDDMEIVFVGWENLSDGTNAKVDPVDQLEAVQLEKYPRFTDIITYGGSRYFMQEHLGFGNDLLIEDDGTYADSAEVQAMPTYPNDGSIAVIDGKVIVKLGE